MLARLSSTSITRFVLSVGLLHLSSAFLRGRCLWSIGQRDHDRDSIVGVPAQARVLVGDANIDGLELRCGAFHRDIVAPEVLSADAKTFHSGSICLACCRASLTWEKVMALSPRMTRTTGTFLSES